MTRQERIYRLACKLENKAILARNGWPDDEAAMLAYARAARDAALDLCGLLEQIKTSHES
jgi:hypothetical protein